MTTQQEQLLKLINQNEEYAQFIKYLRSSNLDDAQLNKKIVTTFPILLCQTIIAYKRLTEDRIEYLKQQLKKEEK
jgi:hypothetical protein